MSFQILQSVLILNMKSIIEYLDIKPVTGWFVPGSDALHVDGCYREV